MVPSPYDLVGGTLNPSSLTHSTHATEILLNIKSGASMSVQEKCIASVLFGLKSTSNYLAQTEINLKL